MVNQIVATEIATVEMEIVVTQTEMVGMAVTVEMEIVVTLETEMVGMAVTAEMEMAENNI